MPDQIIIPETGIPISERPVFTGYNWRESHFKLAENKLYMPTPALFMHYYTKARDAHQGKLRLKRPSGEELTQEQVNKLWNLLSNCWVYLDAIFPQETDGLKIITGHRVVDGELKGNKESLEEYVRKNSYVDLKFNRQGMPTTRSKIQDCQRGENIYFLKPTAGRVARFSAGSDGAFLYCDRDPDGHYESLGVFGCGEATQKNSPQKVEAYTPEQIANTLKQLKLSGLEEKLISALREDV